MVSLVEKVKSKLFCCLYQLMGMLIIIVLPCVNLCIDKCTAISILYVTSVMGAMYRRGRTSQNCT